MERKLSHRLGLAMMGMIAIVALGASPGCSTRPHTEDRIVSLGAFDGTPRAGGWSLGAGDALGAELFACYLVLHESPTEPVELLARPE